jgi:hypothetical protein
MFSECSSMNLNDSLRNPEDLVGSTDDNPHEPDSIPLDNLTYPGFIGDTVDWIRRTASRDQPVLAFGAALAALSVLVTRRVVYQGTERTTGNVYVLGLGSTGAGKDHARKQIQRLLRAGGAGSLIAENFSSEPAILKCLSRRPETLATIDELGDGLKAINKSSTGYAIKIIEAFKKLKGSVDNPEYNPPAVGYEDRKPIPNPALVLYGVTTPDGFWEALTAQQARDGLLSRFLVFACKGRVRANLQKSHEEPPEELVNLVKAWRGFGYPGGNLDGNPISPARFTPIGHNNDAKEAIERIHSQIDDRLLEYPEESLEASLWSRASENVNQLALLASCSRWTGNPSESLEVSKPDALWAGTLAIRITEFMTAKALGNVAASSWDALQLRVRRYLQREPLTQRDLQRKMSDVKPKYFKECLETLLENGVIELVSTPNKHGKPTNIYRLTPSRS